MNTDYIKKVESVKDKILSIDVPTEILLSAIKGAEYTLMVRKEASRETVKSG